MVVPVRRGLTRPSRRREAEEQLGGDVVRARLQDPQGVVRTAEEAQLQPREELEAAVDSIAFGEVGQRIQRTPRCGCGPAVWMGLGFGGWSTGVLEDVACRASRVGDRFAAESKAFTLDQRRTCSATPGNQTLELLLCRLSMANRAWSTLSPRTSVGSSLVGPGLLESSERTARCGRGAM